MEPNPYVSAHRKALRMAIASTCVDVGFASMTESSLETLTEMTVSYIHELAKSSRGLAEVAGRYMRRDGCETRRTTLSRLAPTCWSAFARVIIPSFAQDSTDDNGYLVSARGDGLRRDFLARISAPASAQTQHNFLSWPDPRAQQAEDASSGG